MSTTVSSWEFDTVELAPRPIPARYPARQLPTDPRRRTDDLLADLATSETPVEGVCRRVVMRYGLGPVELARLVSLTGTFSRALQLLTWLLRAHRFVVWSYVPGVEQKLDGSVDDHLHQVGHERAVTRLAVLLAPVNDHPRLTTEAMRSHLLQELPGPGLTHFPTYANKGDLMALLTAARLAHQVVIAERTCWCYQSTTRSEVQPC